MELVQVKQGNAKTSPMDRVTAEHMVRVAELLFSSPLEIVEAETPEQIHLKLLEGGKRK